MCTYAKTETRHMMNILLWVLQVLAVLKYREIAPIMMSSVLGLLMAFIAYGRMVLNPIF